MHMIILTYLASLRLAWPARWNDYNGGQIKLYQICSLLDQDRNKRWIEIENRLPVVILSFGRIRAFRPL